MQWTLFIAHRRNMIVGDEVKIIWTVLLTVFIFWCQVSEMSLQIFAHKFWARIKNQTQNLIWDIGEISLKQTFSQPTCRVLHFLRTFKKFVWFSSIDSVYCIDSVWFILELDLILTMRLGSFTGYKSEVKCTTDIGSLPPTYLALTLVENIS